MAAAPFPASTLRLQTLGLLRDQILSQSLMDGQSLDDFIIGTLIQPSSTTPARSGREISAAALTGRIRSDAGLMRQASRNMSEAGSIAEIAKTATSSIKDSLARMRELAKSVAAGTASADAAAEYTDLANAIAGTVASTSYNGIKLLDSSAWGQDERLAYTQGADTASLSIQAGMAPTTFTLRGMNFLDGAFNAATDLQDAASATAAVERLSSLAGRVGTIAGGYASMAASYGSEAKSFTHQAEILSSTAARAELGAGRDPRSILFDLLLRNSGRLVDHSS